MSKIFCLTCEKIHEKRFSCGDLPEPNDTQPKLACEKHHRILIGKDKCIDCKPMQEPSNLGKPTDQKPIWEDESLIKEINDIWLIPGFKSKPSEVHATLDLIKQVEKAAYVQGYKDGSGEIAADVEALSEQYNQGYERGKTEFLCRKCKVSHVNHLINCGYHDVEEFYKE